MSENQKLYEEPDDSLSLQSTENYENDKESESPSLSSSRLKIMVLASMAGGLAALSNPMTTSLYTNSGDNASPQRIWAPQQDHIATQLQQYVQTVSAREISPTKVTALTREVKPEWTNLFNQIDPAKAAESIVIVAGIVGGSIWVLLGCGNKKDSLTSPPTRPLPRYEASIFSDE